MVILHSVSVQSSSLAMEDVMTTRRTVLLLLRTEARTFFVPLTAGSMISRCLSSAYT